MLIPVFLAVVDTQWSPLNKSAQFFNVRFIKYIKKMHYGHSFYEALHEGFDHLENYTRRKENIDLGWVEQYLLS